MVNGTQPQFPNVDISTLEYEPARPAGRPDETRVAVTMYAAIIGGRPTVDPSLRPLDRSRRHGLLRRHRDGLPVLADVADWLAGVGTAAARKIAPTRGRAGSGAH